MKRPRQVAFLSHPIRCELLEGRQLLAAGTLDTTFASGGIVYGPNGTMTDMLVQPDKRIVVAMGNALLRYNANGTRDVTFDGDGRLDVRAQAVAIQADGKLIVSGDSDTSDNVIHLTRYNSNGSLDTTFGEGGHAAADFGPQSDLEKLAEVFDLVVGPDGKIIAAGEASSADLHSLALAAARFNSDGPLDTSFAGDGTVLVATSGPHAVANVAALQSDGKILLGGEAGDSAGINGYIVRLNADGSLDSSFDGDGIVQPNNLRYDRVVGLAQQGDRIVYASAFQIGRLNDDGSHDTSFANNGVESFGRGFGIDALAHLALQPDGKILALGNIANGENFSEGVLLRLLPNGQRDTAFSSTGYSSKVRLDRRTFAQRVALDADQKIIVGGSADDPTRAKPMHIGLAKFLGDSAGGGGGGGTNQTPFKGSPFNIGDTIQAEDFDNGGEGVAYHDNDATNNGGQYRNTGVDIERTSDTGAGYDVGWTMPGEWIEYTINIPTTGSYDIQTRIASPKSGGSFHYSLDDGAISTNRQSIPNTGGFQNWTTITSQLGTLTAGTHVLRLNLDFVSTGGGMANFNWLKIVNHTEVGNGLLGTYYDNPDFTGFVHSRVDANVNFNWGTGSPMTGVAPDTFSVRWDGEVVAQKTERYTFYTRTDDGVRLWVNNKLLIDHWTPQAATEWSGSIDLVAGQHYTIKMEYFERYGGALAQLSWSSATTPKQIIPSTQLFAAGTADV